jgi:hypothetical protein
MLTLVILTMTRVVAPPPMRGWMTWERFTCETDCVAFPETCIGEVLIKTTADAMVEEGLVAAGYNHIQIDDCWQAPHRDVTSGAIVPDTKRFPSGMKALADYVRSRGMSLGIYGDIGSQTCGGFVGFNISATPDPVQDANLAADVAMMMSWGISSLKVDGCYADVRTMNITYPKLGAALKKAAEATGRASPWYSCSWPDYVADITCSHQRREPCVPLHQIAATCDSARVWMDISDSWNQPEGNGVGVKNIIDFWAKNPQLAALRNGLPKGSSYRNDPDQLLIGNDGLSRTEAEVQMGMWALWSAPMILSAEIRHGSLSPEMKAILVNVEVLAISDDELGRQATLCTDKECRQTSVLYHGGTSVWNKTLADCSVAVGLVNLGNFGNQGKAFGDFNVSFTARAIGLPCTSQSFAVRDLFKGTDLGVFHHGFWREVDESSMLLLKVTCATEEPPAPTVWLDAKPFLRGTGFLASQKSNFYDRLPAAAEHTTRPPVWSLSRDTAGMYLQFISNASKLAVNVTYIYSTMSMWHFPSTGVAGLDLYAFDATNATWRWLATTNPSEAKAGVPHMSTLKTADHGSSLIQYRLHLPLYNGVSSISLGINGAPAVLFPDPTLDTKKPIVWYGTSIAQGGVASRPGMAFTNILTRRLGREVLNFGFSGNCLMEAGVAQWLAQIDAAAFVVDCSWNMDADMIANRTVPLIHQLRAAAPAIPIILAEDTEDGSAWAVPTAKDKQAAKRVHLHAAFDALVNSTTTPDPDLHYVRGRQLYTFTQRVGGVERSIISPTVGGCHPSDLGMLAIANFYADFLPSLLTDDGRDAAADGATVEGVAAQMYDSGRLKPEPLQTRAATATTEEARHHVTALRSLEDDGQTKDDQPHHRPHESSSIVWVPVGSEGLRVFGRAFNDTRSGEYFDRLPARANGVVRDDVWDREIRGIQTRAAALHGLR